MYENPDERINLYNRFKTEVSTGSSSSDYFDEDDLIEIYDYAGDIGDEYVRMEVLFYGARHYPDSDALAVRRGYFYYSISNDEGAAIVANGSRGQGTLWEILSLRLKNPGHDEACEALDRIVGNAYDFDDESVIQLVDAASALNAYEWLKSNKEAIQCKCSYPQTLLYEISAVAEINSDFEYATTIIEQLTMLEPFNVSYWELLAQDHYNCGNCEGALNAIEYAMAIEPQSVKAMLIKAQALYGLGRDIDIAKGLLRKVIELEPENAYAFRILAEILANEGNREESAELLKEYNGRHPEERCIIDYLLILGYCSEPIMQTYFNLESNHEENYWTEWAESYASAHDSLSAVMILQCYERNIGILRNRELYYEQLYLSGRYKDIAEMYCRDMLCEKQFFITSVISFIAILSFIRTDDIVSVDMEISRQLSCNIDFKPQTVKEALENKGIMTVLQRLKADIEAGRHIDIDEYDPFPASPKPPVA